MNDNGIDMLYFAYHGKIRNIEEGDVERTALVPCTMKKAPAFYSKKGKTGQLWLAILFTILLLFVLDPILACNAHHHPSSSKPPLFLGIRQTTFHRHHVMHETIPSLQLVRNNRQQNNEKYREHHDHANDISFSTRKPQRRTPTTVAISNLVMTLRGGSTTVTTNSSNNNLILRVLNNPSKLICWIVLLTSILIDTFCATLMKVAREENSISKLILAYSGFFLSLSGFGFSLASIDVSIAYAVWAALGTAIVTMAGIVLFNEKCDRMKVCSLFMVIIGVVGLNLTEEH